MNKIKVNDRSETPKNFTGIVEFSSGAKHWFKDGEYHREDGPALEFLDGGHVWLLKGKWYPQINLKDHIVLDYYKGKCGLMWYKLLDKDNVLDYPDIPGLIEK